VLNHVLSCSMLVFAFMMAVVSFNHGAVIMFVLAESVMYFLWYCRGLLYFSICLRNTDSADRHAHHKKQKYFFHPCNVLGPAILPVYIWQLVCQEGLELLSGGY